METSRALLFPDKQGMLHFSRKQGQSLMIGDNVRIFFDKCTHGKCRISIEAPQTTGVWRRELWERRQAEQESAHGGPAEPSTE